MQGKIDKRVNVFFTLFLLCVFLLIGCSNDKATLENSSTEAEESREIKVAEKIEEAEIILPDESERATEFPWDEDEEFKSIQEANETETLIAGYVAVFNDSIPEEFENIDIAAQQINGTVLKPGEVFSQNEIAGPYTEERGYKEGIGYVGGEAVKDFGGGVCNVATTLYNTSILSNLAIVERHNHSMPVSYVPYGQDAAVAYGYKDFQFRNNTEDPMLIWTELVDNRLYMAFYGKEIAPDITWEHETLSETPTTTTYKTNPDLAKGEEKVVINGMDGKVVNSILKIKSELGEEEIVDLGNSSYNPLVNLIEVNE